MQAQENKDEIRAELEKLRSDYDLPGMAAVAFRWNELLALEATGVRRQGSQEAFTREDKVHLGSITKSMTATLTAILVGDGVLTWDTTIEEVWGEEGVAPGFRGVSLRSLLRHRGGFPSQTRGAPWSQWMRKEGSERQQRERLLRGALGQEPAYSPDSKAQYANLNFVMVGAMQEKVTGQLWESLIEERLFGPLRMSQTGFGPMASVGEEDQPWGHTAEGRAIAPEHPGADNPPSLAPAGTVHCSLRDLARYGAFHLSRGKSAPGVLEEAAFDVLHGKANAADDAWGLGWVRVKRDWAKGMALRHNGSNTLHMASIWLAPEADFGAAVVANIGGAKASKACDEMVGKLVVRFLMGGGS
jgi:CubicO group peptidase (beta-lactamase class C family)